MAVIRSIGAKPTPVLMTIAVVLAVSGCAARQATVPAYRLAKRDTAEVLSPPGLGTRPIARKTFRAGVLAGPGSCDGTNDAAGIRKRGNGLIVTVVPDRLAKRPQGWLDGWSAGLEVQGCIAGGAALMLASQIAESIPLELNTAFALLHANDRQSGVVDLGPQVRLQVVSPILKDSAAPGDPVVTSTGGTSLTVSLVNTNLQGYETDWYVFRARTPGPGYTLAPDYAERHVNDETVRREGPSTNYLRFNPDAAFYRLIYKSGQTGFTAIVLGAKTRADLDRETAGLSSCEGIDPGFCVAVPHGFAVNPMVSITVNGKSTMAAWRSTVSDAIRQAGERRPEDVLERLSVHRLYRGEPVPVEFDPQDPAILRLILNGGEVISWTEAPRSSPPRSAANDSGRPR
jgi:hypothetical protein